MAGKHEIIYCGGQFHFDYLRPDFMENAAADYRSVLLGSTDALLRGSGAAAVGEGLSYIGPYYFETDGMLDRDIVETEMRMIENCTHAFFLLEDAQLFRGGPEDRQIRLRADRRIRRQRSALPGLHAGEAGHSGTHPLPQSFRTSGLRK